MFSLSTEGPFKLVSAVPSAPQVRQQGEVGRTQVVAQLAVLVEVTLGAEKADMAGL
jgi:hypothetical protein